MNDSVNTKYKSQMAEKDYKQSIEELNQAYDELESEYRPIL